MPERKTRRSNRLKQARLVATMNTQKETTIIEKKKHQEEDKEQRQQSKNHWPRKSFKAVAQNPKDAAPNKKNSIPDCKTELGQSNGYEKLSDYEQDSRNAQICERR